MLLKTLLISITFLVSYPLFSQNYFNGKKLYCTTNKEALELFNSGIKVLHLNSDLNQKYLDKNIDLFAKAILADTNFCDAYFFTAYTLSLKGNLDLAWALYFRANELSPKPSNEFLMNLAITSLRIGQDSIARKSYEDMILHFPKSSEGYFGVALTSPLIGDYNNGLNNIEIAISKTLNAKQKVKPDMLFIKAVMLTLNEKYLESIEFFEKVKSKYDDDENFKIHYSLSLLKVSEINKDNKMKDKAKKMYAKIKNKNEIPAPLIGLFNF